MKPPLEMTLAEVQYLIGAHCPQAEHDKARVYIEELIHIVDFIEERVMCYVPIQHSCDYCNEIRNKKPRSEPKVKEKESPIAFSLD